MHASSNSTSTQRRVLVLSAVDSSENDISSRFGPDVHIQRVRSFDEAFAALRDGRYDYVVTDQGEFLTLERFVNNRQAGLVLEAIEQGVCIVDFSGELIWANAAMTSLPDELTGKICSACQHLYERADRRASDKPVEHRPRRISLAAGDDQYFDISITPVVGKDNVATQAAAVVWDVTDQRRLRRKLDAIDVAGRELVRLDAETTAAMTIEARISLLEQKILRYMHDLLHFDNFAVLLIDKKTNRIEMALQHGMSERSRDLDIFSSPEGNGISGYVASIGRSYICTDTSKDPRYLPGLDSARSSLTVPIRLHDKVIGVFDIESDKVQAFDEDDRQFAEILARYIAIALNILDLLVTERYESTGRLADDVIEEIAGPLNDIVTESTSIMDEYIGDDDLRQRLGSIRDNIAEIKAIIREVASPKSGILGRRTDSPVDDPLLAGKRILVADDEEIIRETVSAVLRKHGCIVETACDGREAVDALGQDQFDLVVADIKMPGKSGYEVFAAARDAGRDIPVILMTGFGYDPNHSIVRARGEGLSAVLFKPFKVDQLINEVHSAVRSSA